jgi:large subunit ribosomal protein L20
MVKGYRFGRSTKERGAREAIAHAGTYSFAHRRDKKADRRRTNQVKIGASSTTLGMSYSKFMGALKKNNIALDRKILADLAKNNPATFERIMKAI